MTIERAWLRPLLEFRTGRTTRGEAEEPQAVRDDEQARQRHRSAGDHRVQHAGRRQGDRDDVVGESPEQVRLDRGERAAREADRVRDRAEVVAHDRDVTGLDRDVRAGAHGDAEVGLGERGRIVHAVTHHRHDVAVALQITNHVELALGHHLGHHLRGFEAELAPDGEGGRRVVAREHEHRQTELPQLFERSMARGAHGVGDDEGGAHLAVPRRDDHRAPIGLGSLDGVADLGRDREAELGGQRGTTGDDGVAVHDALDTEAGAAAKALDRREPTNACGGPRDRLSDRMLGARFHGADDSQCFVPRHAGRHHVDECHRPGRDGARLVEDDGVDGARRLQDLGALDEDAELRASPGPSKQSGGCREAERARAGDDQHRDRGRERAVDVAGRDDPSDERDQGDHDDRRHEDGRDPVRQPLGLRLA